MWTLLVSTAFVVGYIVGSLKTEYKIWQTRKDEHKYVWVCPKGSYHFTTQSSEKTAVDMIREQHEQTCDRS